MGRLIHSIRTAGKGFRERLKRAKLSVAKMLGDREARRKLEAIDRFKRETGVKYVSPRAYGYSTGNLEFLLRAWRNRIRAVRELEKALRERGILLDPEQERMLKTLKRDALRDPSLAEAVAISAGYMHSNRGAVAWASPLLKTETRSRWRRYLLWKLLGPFRPKSIKEFVGGYNEARKGKFPFWGAGKYFALYEDPEKQKMYRTIVDLIGGERFAPKALHPSLRTADRDPKRAAQLAELMAAVGEVLRNHNNLKEIIVDGFTAHAGSEMSGEASRAFDVVLGKLRERTGEEIQDLLLEGRYSDRVRKVYQLKGAWAEILKKHGIKDILDRLRSDKLSEAERRKLEEEYSKALHSAAEEFVRLLEGDEMLRRWFSRLRRKIRRRVEGKKPGIERPARGTAEGYKVVGAEGFGRPIRRGRVEIEHPYDTEAVTTEREPKAKVDIRRAAAREEKKQRTVHLMDFIEGVIREATGELPAEGRYVNVKTDELYRKLFYELKRNRIETNALHAEDPEILEDVKREIRAALLSSLYRNVPEIPKDEKLFDLLRDAEAKKQAVEEWKERLAELKEKEREHHERRMKVAERVAEMLAEHVYASPNMKREILKLVERAAERDGAGEYLEKFIGNSLERIGTKTVKGTERVTFEASLRRLMEELKEHEGHVRRAKAEARRAELAIRNLEKDIQRIYRKMEEGKKALAKEREKILERYHEALAREIARILMKRAGKGHVKFTVVSRK